MQVGLEKRHVLLLHSLVRRHFILLKVAALLRVLLDGFKVIVPAEELFLDPVFNELLELVEA